MSDPRPEQGPEPAPVNLDGAGGGSFHTES